MSQKTNPQGKLWKIQLELYVEAISPELAQAIAEIYSFNAQEQLRRLNSDWIEDNTTKLLVSGKPQEISERQYRQAAVKTYNKKLLARTFGQNKAIKLLNRSQSD